MSQSLISESTQLASWTHAERFRLVNALTRRRLISASTAAALLARSAHAQTPDGTAGATRDVETDKGIVTVPARAERVVCADFFGAFAVVDLGLVPIGAGGTGFEGAGEPHETLLADVPSVGDWTEPDVEAVAVAAPDLILRTIDTDDDLYEKLTAIAPTVVLSFQSLSLPEVAVRVGEVLGREEEAASLLAEYEARCAAIAATFDDVLATTSFSFVMSASESTFWLLGPAWTDTTVMVDCGLTIAEPSNSQDGSFVEYSMEELQLLNDSDVLFINAESDGRTPAPDTAILTESPLWPLLTAVQNDKVFAIPYGASCLGHGIVLAARLEEILGELGTR